MNTARVAALVAGALMMVGIDAASAGAAPIKKPPKSSAAGYATSVSVVTSIEATFTLPTFTCTAKTDALSAQIALFDTVNGEESSAVVALLCSKKKVPFYAAETIVDNVANIVPVDIIAGDTIILSATCGSSGTTVSIDDTTISASGQNSSATASTCSNDFVGDLGFLKGKKAVAPLPLFNEIDFSSVMVNGSALGSFTTQTGDYFEGRKNSIVTGPLDDGGTSFSTTQLSH
jgi:hypothetical protein